MFDPAEYNHGQVTGFREDGQNIAAARGGSDREEFEATDAVESEGPFFL